MAKEPVRFSKELAERICADLASGMTLRAVCRQSNMPTQSTVLGWVEEDRCGFAVQYARARERGYAVMAEEIIEIADDGTNDYVVRAKEDGTDVLVDHDHIARSRLRVDTRKWLLSKALPKVYGEKQQITGANDEPLFPAMSVVISRGSQD